ncbi:MAG: 50S ribosomal protein L28 [Anaerolineae bacterium]|nr:50S ribosomal protein L28 [Anaerolineae bacterium]
MAVCANCGKKAQSGNAVSFSKRHTKRKFNPNLQRIKVLEGEKVVRKVYCAKCIKALSKTAGD